MGPGEVSGKYIVGRCGCEVSCGGTQGSLTLDSGLKRKHFDCESTALGSGCVPGLPMHSPFLLLVCKILVFGLVSGRN